MIAPSIAQENGGMSCTSRNGRNGSGTRTSTRLRVYQLDELLRAPSQGLLPTHHIVTLALVILPGEQNALRVFCIEPREVPLHEVTQLVPNQQLKKKRGPRKRSAQEKSDANPPNR